jgi:hypothetical protein
MGRTGWADVAHPNLFDGRADRGRGRRIAVTRKMPLPASAGGQLRRLSCVGPASFQQIICGYHLDARRAVADV